MFPEIPENLAVLSAADLRALAAEIHTAVQSALAEAKDLDEVKQARAFIAKHREITELAREKEAAAREAAEMSDGTDEGDDTSGDASDGTDDSDDDYDSASDDTEDEDDDNEEHQDSSGDDDSNDHQGEASVGKKKVRTNFGVSGADDSGGDEGSGRLSPGKLKARSSVAGVQPGNAFEGWGQLAEALIEQADSIRPNSSERFTVAAIEGNFDEAHQLGPDMVANLRRFDPDLMADMCAPAVPQYDLDCWNTDRRPVRNSMAAFRPDARGAVSIYPSPSLADITDQSPLGVGVWTDDEDSDVYNNSKECAVIECAEPTIYRLYGVWRCLTVQNLLAMTFPELVEAYLNRLAAAHARLAEQQLLEAMGTASVAVAAPALGYGSSVTITSTVLNLLALHQEEERWDNGAMDAWLPRWVAWAMKTDIMRQRRTDGTQVRVPSDARINQMFEDAGVTPHWFIDTPTWAATIPSVQTGGDMNALPDELNMVVAPRGKFAVMDRGELSIGVTGNNIYRDNASNSKNQFTFFFENFEALVDTNSCPAYLLTIEDLCHNGSQIADVAIDCDGTASA